MKGSTHKLGLATVKDLNQSLVSKVYDRTPQQCVYIDIIWKLTQIIGTLRGSIEY